MKNYTSWLNERSSQMHFNEPASVEAIIGGVITAAGPTTEEWIRERPRLLQYQKMAKDIEESLKKKDDKEITVLLQNAKELPLFRQEQNSLWVRIPITGIQDPTLDIENRKTLARYILNKIKNFESWCKEN